MVAPFLVCRVTKLVKDIGPCRRCCWDTLPDYVSRPGDYAIFHLALHFFVPLLVARVLYPARWKPVTLVLVSALLIDLDHLIATSIYDPGRCSIGFHPLHGALATGLYTVLLFFPKTRIIGLGLLIHIALDSIDCQIIGGIWYVG